MFEFLLFSIFYAEQRYDGKLVFDWYVHTLSTSIFFTMLFMDRQRSYYWVDRRHWLRFFYWKMGLSWCTFHVIIIKSLKIFNNDFKQPNRNDLFLIIIEWVHSFTILFKIEMIFNHFNIRVRSLATILLLLRCSLLAIAEILFEVRMPEML